MSERYQTRPEQYLIPQEHTTGGLLSTKCHMEQEMSYTAAEDNALCT